ncbi:MAG: hypothetical protein J5676_06450 [Bacteroidaceae bacterium]|nr:hypothetical protein [Bacteroidaceae bacterium]
MIMSDGLDEIMSAVGGDIEEVNYVRNHISPELQAKFDDEQIQYFVDVIFEYIDSKDEDEEIVVDDVAQYVVAQAKKEEFGVFSLDDISAVVDADLDFLEGVE